MQDLGPSPVPAPAAPPVPPASLPLPGPSATSEAPSAVTSVATPASAEEREMEALMNEVSATLDQLMLAGGASEPNQNANQNSTCNMRQTTLEELPAVVKTPRTTSKVEWANPVVSSVHPLWADEVANPNPSPPNPSDLGEIPPLENPGVVDSQRDVKDYAGVGML